MDLINLSTKENEENGVWVQAELYGVKQDFEVLIYGNNSDHVIKSQIDILKKYKDNVSPEENIDYEVIRESAAKKLACYIGGVREIGTGEVPTLNKVKIDNEEMYVKLLNEIPELAHFVERYAKASKNFLSKEKKNSKEQ